MSEAKPNPVPGTIEWDVQHSANLGFTPQGSAIVDALWFHSMYGSSGLVLILTLNGKWKAYLGPVSFRAAIAPFMVGVSEEGDWGVLSPDPRHCPSEKAQALHVATYGSKVEARIAHAAFHGRFELINYDGPGGGEQ